MNYRHIRIPLTLLCFALFISCNKQDKTLISGNIDYLGSADIYIETIPLHYKYSPKTQYSITVTNGTFQLQIPSSDSGIVNLFIQDQSYPLYIESETELKLEIERSDFPLSLAVLSDNNDWNQSYLNYQNEIEGLDEAIEREMDKYKVGEPNNALELSAQKWKSAEKHLKDTPLHPIYLKVTGEDLVLKLRAVEYSDRHEEDYPTNRKRQEVIDAAVEKNFFSLQSLEAQRAGIRDFTHYYSRTFGIYDSVNAYYGESLAEYDIKHVAYEELNEKRMQILPYIREKQAKAYAEMFLVAERIGEQPMEISEPSYKEYLQKYPEYQEYTDFLTYFYNEIKSVSPGQPAIPFELPDINGKMYTMEDYKDRYVLLDFWAGWCQPCLDEFEDMERIYDKYSRDDLEIVSISTEIDSMLWVNDIQKYGHEWPQLYGGKGFELETFKAYKGGGIPFYILVDREGNIVRYNDFRPSFNFEEIFDHLLQQEN